MEKFVEFPIGTALGYFFGCMISGKKTGEPGLIHWEWFISKFKIHLHHWIVMIILLMIYLYVCGDNFLIVGFLIGGIIHGLTYSDKFEILKL